MSQSPFYIDLPLDGITTQIETVATVAALPTGVPVGSIRYTVDTKTLYTYDGISWNAVAGGGGGSGTVTSVALTAPAEFSVSGSPITTAGTLAITKATQAANIVYSGPSSGGVAQPTFRALVPADLPTAIPATDIANGSVSNTEFQFLDGVTSSIQTQLNAKGVGDVVGPASATAFAPARFDGITGKLLQDTPNVTISNLGEIASNSLTANTALASDSSKHIVSSATTATELGYVSGVTSAIQTQLNAKGAGTVTTVSVTIANGVSGTVTNPTTTPAISLTLGAITPSSVAASGTVTGSNLSGTNTGDQTITLTGDVTGSGTGTFAATVATGAVTDTKASLATKPASMVVATTNQTLSGTPTIDGQATAVGSIILLSAQTAGAENGFWVAAAGAWSRPTWYPSGGTTQAFQFITTLIRLGTTYQGTVWRQTTAAPITIDTTATTWVVTPLAVNASTVTGTLPVANGGTGQTTYTDGQILIGNTATGGLSKNTITQGTGITVTNGNGTITIAASGGGGSGTVTSVALTAPAEFSVAGSPITTSGTLAITKATQTANTVWAGPTTGAAAAPTFRAVVTADLPSIIDYGNSFDGAVTISGNTTLTVSKSYASLTVNGGVTLNTGNFKIFCAGTLLNNGIIDRSGNNGGTSGGSTAGAAGAGTAASDLGGSAGGSAGGVGATGNGTQGAAASDGMGGGAAGASGAGGAGSGGTSPAGAAGGVASGRTANFLTQHLLAGGTAISGGAGGRGGSSGGGDGTNSGRGGGGGGAGGGVILIYAQTLNNAGTISANGGNGGAGGTGATGNVGGGGGGGAGGGGWVYLVYDVLTALGTVNVNGGSLGTGSAGAGTGANGSNGVGGSVGKINKYNGITRVWS